MTGPSAFLAFSIEGRVDGAGRLLSADPHLMRLHLANGGVENGVLAVPSLLAIAQLCWRTGCRLERPARAADGDRDVDLWVQATRNQDHVLLSISGWQERHAVLQTAPSLFGRSEGPYRAKPQADILVDSQGYVLYLDPLWLESWGAEIVGVPFADHFLLAEGNEKWPWQDPGTKVAVRVRRDNSMVFVTAIRRGEGGDPGQGYDLRVESVGEEAADAPPTSTVSPPGFGRHLATAVRQPLQRILANAETIRASHAGSLQDSYLAYAHDIAVAATHLSELIGDLEDLDAIDRQDFKVAAERVELGDIARRVAGLLALKAADHHIRLLLPDLDAPVEVCGEFRRILQITLNLVGNAIRYAPDGSSVHVRIDANPPALHVADEGKGIAAEDRERIFEKFERLGRSGGGGSGLGLYISRRLARAMKGDLTVDAAPEGGAMFTLRLPPWQDA